MALTEVSDEVRSLARSREILLYVGYYEAVLWNVVPFIHVLIGAGMGNSQRRNRIPSDESHGATNDDRTIEEHTVGPL
jgi:hypothetical protein